MEQSKGLDTLLDVAYRLTDLQLAEKVAIDFYGQKTDGYFDESLSGVGMFSYRGVLQPHEVVQTLQQYDALVFPTHYEGEGCPGILVEALSAPLPIIASDWKYNSEFVRDGINGFLCNTYDVEAYIKALLSIYDPVLRKQMKRHSYMMSGLFADATARAKVNRYLKRP